MSILVKKRVISFFLFFYVLRFSYKVDELSTNEWGDDNMASYEKGKYSYNGNTIYYDEAETSAAFKQISSICGDVLDYSESTKNADKCFDGAMVFTLIIMVIILLVLTPVGIVVDKKIEAYFENKREP